MTERGGQTAEAVSTPKGRFGTPICFDCDYEDVIRKMTRDGAEYFIIPSLDATRWGVKQHLQHAELFRHRAAENGRWMMVASGSGMTQLIDPYGKRVKQLELMTEGVLVGYLERRSGLTFYTQYGWLFAWVAMSAGWAWWLWLCLRNHRKKRGENSFILGE